MNGERQRNTEKKQKLWRHITLAYCNVETWFKRKNADVGGDFIAVQAVFESVARFIRNHSSKFGCFQLNLRFTVRDKQEGEGARVRAGPPNTVQFLRTNRPHSQSIQLTRMFLGQNVVTLVVFHTMWLKKHRDIQNVNYGPLSDKTTCDSQALFNVNFGIFWRNISKSYTFFNSLL